MRPSTISSFSVGLALGALGIAAVATFTTTASDHLPTCQSPIVTYASVP
jgi:hypothetical protein